MTSQNKENISELASKECVPCRAGTPPLENQEAANFLKQLGADWKINSSGHLEKEFSFPNFKKALDFTVAIGNLAEQLNHHPSIFLSWGKVKITIWTHKIKGLSENDFILAAKIETLLK
jgi:4a-hydroxytetrahydrobiopterin dehydratase